MEDTFVIENNREAIERLFNQVNELIQSKKVHCTHMVIDGVEIFEDHYEVILDQLNEIHKIEIILKTLKEMVDDTLLSTERYLVRLIPETKQLADQFYQGIETESWVKFEQLLEGIQWLLSLINVIKEQDVKYTNWSQTVSIAENLQNQLIELQVAIENKDNILVGDLISYEFLPLFEGLQKELKTTIDNEVHRHDLN